MEGQFETASVFRRGGGSMMMGAGVSEDGGCGALRARRLGALIVNMKNENENENSER